MKALSSTLCPRVVTCICARVRKKNGEEQGKKLRLIDCNSCILLFTYQNVCSGKGFSRLER